MPKIKAPLDTSTLPKGQELAAELINERLHTIEKVAEWWGCSRRDAAAYLSAEGISIAMIARAVGEPAPAPSLAAVNNHVTVTRPPVLTDRQRTYLRDCPPSELKHFESWVLELARKEGLIR